MQDNTTSRKNIEEAVAKGPGTLYLVATPIGNLEDMTFRAVRVLGEVTMIAAEDTRHTRQLLTHFDIHTRLTSYHEHNKYEKEAELIDFLLAGNDLACVSDAGLPGIADPGSALAQAAIRQGIRVVPLPGANAALSALIASGLDTTRFSFVGFLPRTQQKRRERLAEVKQEKETLLFYEAPHHLKGTLAELLMGLGDRRAVLARELTKRYEEFCRGSLSELLAYYETVEPRGEFVIVVEGAGDVQLGAEEQKAKDSVARVAELVAAGQDRKEAMRTAAKELGLSRRDVYQACLQAGEG